MAASAAKIKTPDVHYIPYALLHSSPIIFYFGKVPVTLRLSDPQTSTISVPPSFRLFDQSDQAHPHSIRVGTSFVLEYKGMECEVRLGRRIVAVEGDSHILL